MGAKVVVSERERHKCNTHTDIHTQHTHRQREKEGEMVREGTRKTASERGGYTLYMCTVHTHTHTHRERESESVREYERV